METDHLIYEPSLTITTNGVLRIDPEEAQHLKVRRVQVSDTVYLTNGKGIRAEGIFEGFKGKSADIRITIVQEFFSTPIYKIRVAICPTKNIDRTEWFLEKAVEMGIDAISFWYGKHSERKEIKMERLERKAVAAMKQSLQSSFAVMDEFQTLSKLLEFGNNEGWDFVFGDMSQSIDAHPLQCNIHPRKEICLIVGPEGGFSSEEEALCVEKGAKGISLGGTRLRTETAAMYGFSCLLALREIHALRSELPQAR